MKTDQLSGLLLAVLFGLSWSMNAQSVALKTTDTALVLNQAWATAYGAKHADTKIEIKTDAVTNAFTELAERKIQLAVTPRLMRFKEAQACEAALGERPSEFKLAVNAVAIYVNTNNPVKELTYDELIAAFEGSRRNWKKLGGGDAPVTALGVAPGSPVGELFLEEVMAGKTLTNDVQIVSPAELSKTIAGNTNAMGFGPMTVANGVRVVEIKRSFSSTPVAPSPETITDRIYPIARFVYGYTDAARPRSEVKTYLDWIRGDDGQRIAKEAGYFPVAAKWRNNP